MKFLRFGPKGQEKPGILFDDGTIRDLSAHTPDFGGVTVSIDALDRLRAIDPLTLPQVEGNPRIGRAV
jgi:hypothetical protein